MKRMFIIDLQLMIMRKLMLLNLQEIESNFLIIKVFKEI